MTVKIISVGEAMIELSRVGTTEWQVGTGGDTLNTATYLSRLGFDVAYLTALGIDPFSAEMRAGWQAEGIDTSLVLTDSDRLPGLYAITTNRIGERSFYYWRQSSAVRKLFDNPHIDEALAQAGQALILYLSGITLSLFDAGGRRRLADLAQTILSQGGQVVFDPNYRPKGWQDADTARNAIEAFAPYVTIAMPTYDDERILYGDPEPAATAARWRGFGASEVIVKNGPKGCIVFGDFETLEVPSSTHIIATDTTGAGDSFNAGYLAARLSGKTRHVAAQFANHLAGTVVRHRGAIMPRAAMPMLTVASEAHGDSAQARPEQPLIKGRTTTP